VTVNVSSGSTTVSPATRIVIVWLVSPGANWTVPLGSWLPVESRWQSAGLVAAARRPVYVDAGRRRWCRPMRVTVNVNGVVPLLPSALLGVLRGDRQ
jgi:hypothetical protein